MMENNKGWVQDRRWTGVFAPRLAKSATSMLAAGALLVVPAVAFAGTVTVNTTTPNSSTDGKCGLVEAVVAMNTQASYRTCSHASGSDRIIFSVNGTHNVPTLNLQRSMVIDGNGPGSTIIRATSATGISANGLSSGTQTISLRDLRITTNLTNMYTYGVFTSGSNPVTVNFNDTVVDRFLIGAYISGAWSTANVTDSVFEDNATGISMNGGALVANFATFRDNTFGGAQIFNYSTARTSFLSDSLFENNQATNGAGLYISSYGDPGELPSLYLNRTEFIGNAASNHGGGLYVAAIVEIDDSTFRNNSAGNIGGGMIAHERSNAATVRVYIERSTFEGNSATHGGGYANYGPSEGQRVKAILKSSTFGPHNVASGDGGGIYSLSQIDWAENLTIHDNSATRGGGLYHYSGGESHVYHCTITNNTATDVGGGLWLQSGNPAYKYNIIAWNRVGTTSSNVVAPYNPSLNAKYNLLNSRSGATSLFPTASSGGTNIIANPRLDPFGFYGGPTKTRRPRSDSPAIDAIPTNDPDTTTSDQRLWYRPMDGDSDGVAENDIGAVEYEL